MPQKTEQKGKTRDINDFWWAVIIVVILIVAVLGGVFYANKFYANKRDKESESNTSQTVVSKENTEPTVVEQVSAPNPCAAPLKLVSTNVCDDEMDTAYVFVKWVPWQPRNLAESNRLDNNDAIDFQQISFVELLSLRSEWQKKFPTKQVTNIIPIMGSNHGNKYFYPVSGSFVIGLLIQYKKL